MKKYFLSAALAALVISFTSFGGSTSAFACGGFMQAKCPPAKPAPAAVVRPGTTPKLAVQNKPLIGPNGGNGIVAQGGGNIVAQGGGNKAGGNGIISTNGGGMRK